MCIMKAENVAFFSRFFLLFFSKSFSLLQMNFSVYTIYMHIHTRRIQAYIIMFRPSFTLTHAHTLKRPVFCIPFRNGKKKLKNFGVKRHVFSI